MIFLLQRSILGRELGEQLQKRIGLNLRLLSSQPRLLSSSGLAFSLLDNELQIKNVTLDNSIAFSGSDPVFQYGVFASAIPEPTPFVLFSAGVVVLAIYTRYTRRRQNQQTAEIGAGLYRA